jgi:hypothetical protein
VRSRYQKVCVRGGQDGARPEHWGHAKEFKVPEGLLKKEGGQEGGGEVRLMAGERINIRRSSGEVQEVVISSFDDQTGDVNVAFAHESGGTATKTIPRQEVEALNPDGSQKE